VENSTSACTGGQAHTYDGRGNLLSDGARTFTYDLENKLTRVTGPGASGTPTDWNTANWNAFTWSGATTTYMGYDPQGRLRQTDAAAGTQQYLYDGNALLVEYDAGGAVLRRYVPGQGVDETLIWYEGADFATPNWLHTDQQGSVVAASNSSGVSATTYAYGPYGEPKNGFASGGPAFRYTGQVQLPAHNLYYYKARMYDPALGRFLQTDPIGYSAGLNLYA
jgi:RHS repeat-associated protein